jgi:spore germination protein
VTESIKIPIINNYKLIVMLFGPIIAFKAAANHYFATINIINTMTGINLQKLYIACAPLIFVTLLYDNEVVRREILGKLTIWITVFNLSYISIVGLIAFFKKNLLSQKINVWSELVLLKQNIELF